MRQYDEELRELQMQFATKNRVETIIKELQDQQKVLEDRVYELAQIKDKEQLDVTRLEGRSLAKFFYQVVGKMDDKLTKERQEAYEAAVRYDAAYRELESINAELRMKEVEYGRVRRSPQRYQEVLKEKQEAVKLSGIPEAAEILRLEAQITSLEIQKKELEEAISAGRSAEQIAEEILQSLSDAEGWGTWDLLGGGLIADMAKHSHLDEAQDNVERLQAALRRFKTELTDVRIHADMQVNIDGFLRFADYFFDGLFADWSVMNRIGEAKEQVQKVKGQIGSVLGKLTASKSSVEKAICSANSNLDEIVKKTSM